MGVDRGLTPDPILCAFGRRGVGFTGVAPRPMLAGAGLTEFYCAW